MGGRRLPVCLSVSDSVSEELLNQKVKSIKVCIHKAGGPQTYSAQRALGETGPSNGSPGPLTPLTQPWYPKTMFCRTMKRFMDQALTKSSSSTIYFCQIPSAWVCQKQFENIYQDCRFKGAKHRKPMKCIQIQAQLCITPHCIRERLLTVCFWRIGFVSFQNLFVGDQLPCSEPCKWLDYLSVLFIKDVKKQ